MVTVTLEQQSTKVWKRRARGGMIPEALGPWIYTLLDGQAAWAQESVDMKDMCTEGGEELVFRELDQRFPDWVAADCVGETLEEAFGLKNHEEQNNGGFHWTVETCGYPSSVGWCEHSVGSARACLTWMSTWEPARSNGHVRNPQKLGVR